MGADSRLLKGGLAIIAGLIVVAVIAFFFLAWRVGMVEAAGRPPIIVATIGLIGVIFTGTITALGLFLKDSYDRRVQLAAKEAEDRLAASTREAEARLRAETSLKAIELMTAKDLTPAIAAERREGAIIALSSLGYLRLNLRLCERFWKDESLSPDLAMTVVNDCLKSKEESLQAAAAAFLRDNAASLAREPGELYFPDAFFTDWRAGLPASINDDLLEALIKAFLSRRLRDWENNRPNQLAFTLYKMFTTETGERFRKMSALFAVKLYQSLEASRRVTFVSPEGSISHRTIYERACEALGVNADGRGPSDLELEMAVTRLARQDHFDLAIDLAGWDQPEHQWRRYGSDQAAEKSGLPDRP